MDMKDVSGGLVSDVKGTSLPIYDSTNVNIMRITQKVGPYMVVVKVNETGQFISIESVAEERSFLNLDQRRSRFKYQDVEKFLEDEE